MSDYTIDPETGLPVLPEGFYFRVFEHGVEVRENLPDREKLPEYSWNCDPTSQKKLVETEKTEEVTYRAWWGVRRTKIVTYTDMVYWEVNRSKLWASERTKKTGEIKHDPEYNLPYEDRYPITKEDIPRLAAKAAKRFYADRAMEELLGDYPPKKFGD